jgi:hypothetical protein
MLCSIRRLVCCCRRCRRCCRGRLLGCKIAAQRPQLRRQAAAAALHGIHLLGALHPLQFELLLQLAALQGCTFLAGLQLGLGFLGGSILLYCGAQAACDEVLELLDVVGAPPQR